MSELKKHLERLVKFAKENGFHKPFSQIYFAEEGSIRRFPDFIEIAELPRQNLFTVESYENRFAGILSRKHSWINMNLAGMMDEALLIVIEFPNDKNIAKITPVNLSLPPAEVIRNDWRVSPFIKII